MVAAPRKISLFLRGWASARVSGRVVHAIEALGTFLVEDGRLRGFWLAPFLTLANSPSENRTGIATQNKENCAACLRRPDIQPDLILRLVSGGIITSFIARAAHPSCIQLLSPLVCPGIPASPAHPFVAPLPPIICHMQLQYASPP
jgi:hypothetical protein